MQLHQILDYLRKRRLLNLVLVFTYGISLILLHDPVVQLSIKAMNSLSLSIYNNVVRWASLAFGLIVVAYMVLALFRNSENREWKLFFLMLSLALAVMHFLVMLEMNIEVIHVIEFTILAVLIFPFIGRYGAAIVFCLPFILVNEWYQYQVLYPGYIKYFEFNDVFMDLVGCGLAMIALWVSGIKPIKSIPTFWKRPEFLSLMGLIGFYAIAITTCLLALYTATQCENTWLVLSLLEEPSQFWQTHEFTGATYHVMNPKEGMIAISLLCILYMVMDNLAYTK